MGEQMIGQLLLEVADLKEGARALRAETRAKASRTRVAILLAEVNGLREHIVALTNLVQNQSDRLDAAMAKTEGE